MVVVMVVVVVVGRGILLELGLQAAIFEGFLGRRGGWEESEDRSTRKIGRVEGMSTCTTCTQE